MSYHAAEVKLAGLEFVKANPFGQQFILNINIKNTGSEVLFVRTLNYKIMINGIEVNTGEELIWQEIPAFSTQKVNVLASTNIWEQLKPIVKSIKNYKEVNYYLTGQLITGTLLFQRVSYVNHSGTFTPDQLPMKKIKKLQQLANSLKI